MESVMDAVDVFVVLSYLVLFACIYILSFKLVRLAHLMCQAKRD